MKAALYCRVSTSDQKEEGTSLDTQRDLGLLKAKELGWQVPEEYIIQEDWTGKDLKRPGLMRLIDLAISGKAQGVIIFTLDRLYRPENDGDEWRVFELLERLTKAGAQVAWVDPSIPAQGPLSSIFTFLDAWRSGRERRSILERTTRGRLEKARRGKVVSSACASYGYRFDPATSMLTIHENEAGVVRMIFSLYTQNRISLVQLCDRLNRMGIERPRGGQRWYVSGINRILRNETYAGTLWQNRHHDEKVMTAQSGTGKHPLVKTGKRPRDEQIPTAVLPIVSVAVFESAQKRLDENLRLASRNTKRQYLLTGLIRHSCGATMGGRSSKGRLHYRCLKSHKFRAPINEKGDPKPCTCDWVSGPRLESLVWDKVAGLLRQPQMLLEEMEKLARPDSLTREALQAEIVLAKKRLAELPQEERRLVEGYRKGLYPDVMMRKEMDHIRGEQVEAERGVKETGRKISQLDKALSYKDQLEGFAEKMGRGLEAMSFDERRELLRLLIEGITYDEGELTIRTIIPLEERQLHPVSGEGRERVIPSYSNNHPVVLVAPSPWSSPTKGERRRRRDGLLRAAPRNDFGGWVGAGGCVPSAALRAGFRNLAWTRAEALTVFWLPRSEQPFQSRTRSARI